MVRWTRFYMCPKADCYHYQLNLLHGTNKTEKVMKRTENKKPTCSEEAVRSGVHGRSPEEGRECIV